MKLNNLINNQHFHAVIQITKLITFEISYYRCGSNKDAYFSTSAIQFIKSKRDYRYSGQAQDILTGDAHAFYKKWNYLHLKDMTNTQYDEMIQDLTKLAAKHNTLIELGDIAFNFNGIVEFSKQNLKK